MEHVSLLTRVYLASDIALGAWQVLSKYHVKSLRQHLNWATVLGIIIFA